MHFTSMAWPLVALIATVQAAGPSVTVYSDAKCTKMIQTIQMTTSGYGCYDFSSTKAQGVIFSKQGFTNKGFNVWDSQFCAGDQAGSPATLGTCLSAANYGLAAWKSAHISPRNTNPQ